MGIDALELFHSVTISESAAVVTSGVGELPEGEASNSTSQNSVIFSSIGEVLRNIMGSSPVERCKIWCVS